MIRVALAEPDSLPLFRDAARGLIATETRPQDVAWDDGSAADLFGTAPAPQSDTPLAVPVPFVTLAKDVVCHREAERFALLYEALWRITHGERALLAIASDPLVHRLMRMQKSVRRDCHKMTAFLRFRRVGGDDGERYVAWFEPEHRILRRVADFFVDRFAAMRWSILTPDGAMHWDGAALTFGPGMTRDQAPPDDALEDWWRSYYRATFNPARANPTMMRTEMPKKYWRNLPEAELIPDLLAQARSRSAAMIAAAPPAPRATAHKAFAAAAIPAGTLAHIKAEAQVCQRCPLYCDATQTIFGEGPADAPVMFVGEQPGDHEDLAGRPFVGPAGQMFDRALEQAGLDRTQAYVTNAVKHFKFELRGKRRLHKKPDRAEIDRCRWWLDREIGMIRPRLIVAMGATAVRALTGRDVTLGRERGRITAFGDTPGLITVHPSYLLRLPDARARAAEYDRFVADLRLAGEEIPAIRIAA